MSAVTIQNQVFNQRQTPALIADIFDNRPLPGYLGRIFFQTDSPFSIYRDYGTEWVQIGGGGGGGGVVSAANGVQLNPGDNTQVILGGSLLQDTQIEFDGSILNFTDFRSAVLVNIFEFAKDRFYAPYLNNDSNGLISYSDLQKNYPYFKVNSGADSPTLNIGGDGAAQAFNVTGGRLKLFNLAGGLYQWRTLDISNANGLILYGQYGYNDWVRLQVDDTGFYYYFSYTNPTVTFKITDTVFNVLPLANSNTQNFLQSDTSGNITSVSLPTTNYINAGNTDYTLTANDYNVGFNNLTNDVQVFLPDPTTFIKPQYFIVKIEDANPGNYQIIFTNYPVDDTVNFGFTGYQANRIYSNGTKWLTW